MNAAEVVARVARTRHGRLLAALASRSGDLVASEDALSEAFARALATWPSRGVPERPEAWILTVALNGLRDRQRRLGTVERFADALSAEASGQGDPVRDERLALLFACTHPAVDPSVHTPLMLQVVLGLSAATIASAFLVSPASLAKRLVRAKAGLAEAKVSFTLPEPSECSARLGPVLDAIYVAFTCSADQDAAGPRRGVSLRDEALDLGELVVAELPDEPEAQGLLALMLYGRARDAERGGAGGFVPFDDQDPAGWDAARIDRAEALLHAAAAHGELGRFQLEAAIQSCHLARRRGRGATWRDVVRLYEVLVERFPTVGAWLGWCAAAAHVEGPDAALTALDRLDPADVREHQPYWAVRAELLERVGRREEARASARRAAALAVDPAVRAWLLTRFGA